MSITSLFLSQSADLGDNFPVREENWEISCITTPEMNIQTKQREEKKKSWKIHVIIFSKKERERGLKIKPILFFLSKMLNHDNM